MVSRPRSNSVIELGARLAAQLGRDGDLLASWMSHYVAELIEKASTAPANQQAAAQQAAAAAILELWRHRAFLPRGLRPLESLEPVLRTLASLDEEHDSKRYHYRARNEAEASPHNEVHKWLEFARDIDDTARALIGVAVGSAVAAVEESISPWVELADDAALNDNVEYQVFMFAKKALESGDKAREKEALLRLRLARIESFLKEGAELADDLRAHLDGTVADRTSRHADRLSEGNPLFIADEDEDEDEDEE